MAVEAPREHELIMAGHGGQGIISAADLIGSAANALGLNALCRMVYGAEMRGGIVECTVIVSPEEITSPYSESPEALLAMNEEAWDSYLALVRPGGIAIANASLIKNAESARKDIVIVTVPCVAIAEQLGSIRVSTSVGVGALVGATGIVSLEAVEAAFADVLPERHHKLIPLNAAAVRAGAERARTALAGHLLPSLA